MNISPNQKQEVKTQAVAQGQQVNYASLDAGNHHGTLKNYAPRRVYSAEQARFERILSSQRAEDLYTNDWAAKSATNTVAINVVGTGLRPQAAIAYRELGLEKAEALELQNQMEWLWAEWNLQAHYREQFHFEDLQALAVRSLVRNGEFVHLPVMEERAYSRFALRIQDIRPSRLCTPQMYAHNAFFHDGIEVSATGIPQAYYIHSPKESFTFGDASQNITSFHKIPANVGHRKGIFHCFLAEYEEQYRGVSALATATKFFKHFNDAIDYELVAQVLAASFPVFIALEDKSSGVPSYVQEEKISADDEPRYYQSVQPNTIMYGNKGEKPEILESKRPSQNFMNFSELMIRVCGASLGLPYEEISKDFSKTTYSSARAAILEAWRTYNYYRNFFRSHYCQPIYNMVMEEAYLRKLFILPKKINFYESMDKLLNVHWIGPARGYIDPVKEIQANILAIDNNLMTRSEAIAERGGDFDELAQQKAYENERLGELGLKNNEESDGITKPSVLLPRGATEDNE